VKSSTPRTKLPTCKLAVPELDRGGSRSTRNRSCEACEGSASRATEAALEGEDRGLHVVRRSRLSPVPRAVRLEGSRYHEIVSLSVSRALQPSKPAFPGDRARIAEARGRAREASPVSPEVGLSYLSLDRAARKLSGGEMQRLASRRQLGSVSLGALTCSTSPRSALHLARHERLLSNLHALVETGSTVLVVEQTPTPSEPRLPHRPRPSGGRHGGRVVAPGRRPRCSRRGVAHREGVCRTARSSSAGHVKVRGRFHRAHGCRAHKLRTSTCGCRSAA